MVYKGQCNFCKWNTQRILCIAFNDCSITASVILNEKVAVLPPYDHY